LLTAALVSEALALGQYIDLGSRLLFTANDGRSGHEPWVTDGTVAGTRLLLDIGSSGWGSDPVLLGELEGKLLLAANDGVSGRELWVADASGASLVSDIAVGPASSQPRGFARLGRQACFFANGNELWRTDGTSPGTANVVAIPDSIPTERGMTTSGALLYFYARRGGSIDLWCSDGSAAGTRVVASVPVVFATPDPGPMTAFDGQVFFTRHESGTGTELWTSDGTSAGTRLVADLEPGAGSSIPYSTIVHEGRLYFWARVGGSTYLWRLDHAAAAPVRVVTKPAPSSSSVGPFQPALGKLFYRDQTTAAWGLWCTDGTQAGTKLVKEFLTAPSSYPGPIAGTPDRLYFAMTDPEHGTELWISDGTEVGTNLVADIAAGSASSIVLGIGIAVGSAGHLLFVADDGVHGEELWISDGTQAGTLLAADVAPARLASAPRQLLALGSSIWFVADDGEHGNEPWALRLGALGVPLAVSYGVACPGSGGLSPALGARGVPRIGNGAFALGVERARGLSPAVMLLGSSRSYVPIGAGCEVLVGGDAFGLPFGTDASGRGSFALPIPQEPALQGAELFAQAAIVDPGGAYRGLISLSDALLVLVGR
jgi:ELWxxDGT repeat protein